MHLWLQALAGVEHRLPVSLVLVTLHSFREKPMANDLSNDSPYGTGAGTGTDRTAAGANNGNGAASARGERFEKVVSGAHEAVDSAAESIAQAADALRDKANRLGDMEKEYAEACRSSVREHPLSYLAGALLLGVLIGRLSR
jgi:hypothetical protein